METMKENKPSPEPAGREAAGHSVSPWPPSAQRPRAGVRLTPQHPWMCIHQKHDQTCRYHLCPSHVYDLNHLPFTAIKRTQTTKWSVVNV